MIRRNCTKRRPAVVGSASFPRYWWPRPIQPEARTFPKHPGDPYTTQSTLDKEPIPCRDPVGNSESPASKRFGRPLRISQCWPKLIPFSVSFLGEINLGLPVLSRNLCKSPMVSSPMPQRMSALRSPFSLRSCQCLFKHLTSASSERYWRLKDTLSAKRRSGSSRTAE